MNKKIIKIIVFIFVLFSLFLYSHHFSRALENVISDLEYVYELSEDGTYYIMKDIVDNGEVKGDVIFPSEYNNLPIREISEEAILSAGYGNLYYNGTMEDWFQITFATANTNPLNFCGNLYMLDANGEYELIEKMIIPVGVEELKDYSLVDYASSDQELVLPATVKKISKNATVNFNNYVLYYQGTVAEWCNIEIYDFTLANSAKKIYFYDEKNVYYQVVDIVIPDTVAEIKAKQFYGFYDIENIYLSKNVKKIGEMAFGFFSSSGKLYYDGTIEDWCSIEFENPSSNPLYCGMSFYILENGEYTLLKDLVIPKTITNIGKYQFYRSNFRSVTLHKNIEEIEEDAFGIINNLDKLYYDGTIEDWCKIKFASSYSNPLNDAGSFYISNNTSQFTQVIDLVIPGSVKEIGDYQFNGLSGVKTVVIENGVTSIGKFAFFDSRAITSISIAESVEEIKEGAFRWCDNITKINLPKNLSVLETNAINISRLSSLTIPSSIKEIKDQTALYGLKTVYYNGTFEEWKKIINAHFIFGSVTNFYYLNESNDYIKLTDLVIEEGVTTLDNRYIDGYLGLERVYLPKSLKKVSSDFFYGCSNLKEVYYSGSLSDWFKIDFENGSANPINYTKKLYTLNENNQYVETTDIVIPNDVTVLKANSIANLESLKVITLHKNIEKIETKAFYKCQNLETVYFNGTVSDWLNIIFEDAYSNPLYYAKYLYVLNETGEYEELKELIIPEGTKEIGQYQFAYFTGFTKIVLPDSLEEVGTYAFYSTKCEILEIGKNIKNIGSMAFSQAAGSYAKKTLYFRGTLLDWLTLTEEMTNLVNSISVYTTSEYLLDENGEFYSLTEVVIPENCEVIHSGAFSSLNNLTKITIPSHVKLIETKAIYNLLNLETLIIEENEELTFQTNAFYSSAPNIYYQGSVDGWLKINFVDYTATPISSRTKLYFLDENNEYFELKNLVIPETVTEIKDYLFVNYSYLEEITISSTLTSIGVQAFAGCSNLKTVNIPNENSLEKIGLNAFYYCRTLTNINLEVCQSLNIIDSQCFYGDEALTEITLPRNLEKLGEYVFHECRNLSKINFQENSKLEVISNSCFEDTSIAEIIIPKSVKSIGGRAFYGCNKLKKVEFEEDSKIEIINYDAFYNAAINNIYLPTSIKKIGRDAFGNNQKTIYYDGNIFDWCNIETYSNIILNNTTLKLLSENKEYLSQKEITIPKEIKKISSRFWDANLKTVYYEGTLSDWLNLEFVYETSNPMTVAAKIYFKGENGEYTELNSEMIIPENITKIGDYQFAGYKKLTKVVVHNNVEYLGIGAFKNCINLEEMIFEENSKIDVLSSECFYNCSDLRLFKTPDNVTYIMDNAFYSCNQLVSLVIPKTTTNLVFSAINNCKNLKLIYNLSNIKNEKLKTDYNLLVVNSMTDERVIIIGDYIFVKIDDVNYLAGYTGKEDHLILPHDVNGEKYTISGYAFYMNDFIKSIEISDLVTKIGEKAFYNCSNLREVIITENSLLEEIEYYAFYNCLKLRSFVLPKNLNILNDPFYNCINVRVVYNLSRYSETVVKGMFRYAEVIVNTIRNDDFIKYDDFVFININGEYELIDYVGNDVNIILPEEIEGNSYIIEEKTFKNNYNIESIVITKGVKDFEPYALSEMGNLKSVIFEEDVIIKKFANYLFKECTSLESITIPKTIEYIGIGAFYNCTNLASIEIPSNVTNMGYNVFEKCANLKEVTFEENGKLTIIPNYTFIDCISLESIVIPNTITSIGSNAFVNCTNLKEVTFEENAEITIISGYAFKNCASLESITIPKKIKEIRNYAFQDCINLKEINFEDNSEILNIDAGAFYNCQSLEVFSFPKGITTVSGYVLAYCSNLKTLYLTNNITSIGSNAFYECDNMETVYYDGTINNWNDIQFYSYGNGNVPFNGADKFYTIVDGQYKLVEKVVFDSETTRVGTGVFFGYEGLKEVVLSSSIKEIGDAAFAYCVNLNNVTFTEGLEIIGDYAFSVCTSLEEIDLPKGLTTIEMYIIKNCENLKQIKLPDTLETMSYNSLLACNNLQNIIVDENNPVYKSIDGNLYSKDGTKLLQYAGGKTDELFVIPEGVITIESYALTGTEKFKTVKLPMSLVEIEKPALFTENQWKLIVYENSYGYNFALENNLEYEVVEIEIIRGDLNKDLKITIDDVIYLLMYTYFPSAYEINQYPDFNKDGVINTDDAIYLLMHIYFPNQYPL